MIQPATPKQTILVVDDDHLMRRLVSEMLQLAGYTTLEADGPDQAIQIFEPNYQQIDLVLSDISMPRMNGVDLIARLCARKADLVCVFMSGGNIMPARGTAFLQKPFGIDELHFKVAEALNARAVKQASNGKQKNLEQTT